MPRERAWTTSEPPFDSAMASVRDEASFISFTNLFRLQNMGALHYNDNHHVAEATTD